MPRKRLKMSSKPTIQDLPDEMLEHILLHLDLEDRKSALLVCQRWSALKPLDWSSVQLVVTFGKAEEFHRTLPTCNRRYKHLVFYVASNIEEYDLFCDILSHFSLSVESLKLVPRSEMIELKFFAQIAALCSNLKHLLIGAYHFDDGHGKLEFPPMNNLEELSLQNNLLRLVPNLKDIAPNITRLHLKVGNNLEESCNFLRHFSSRLVELGIWFEEKDLLLTVCTMQFPLLEKLKLNYIDRMDREIGTVGSIEEIDLIDRFFQQLPGLKEVTLRCRIVDRIVQNLCQSCVNLQFLLIGMHGEMLKESFQAICQLKHLKRLRIDRAWISVPQELSFPPLKGLQMLTLLLPWCVDERDVNRFIQYAFPSLVIFELLYPYSYVSRDFVLPSTMCSYIASLQRLVLSVPAANIQLGAFLKFCASCGQRELRIRCRNVLDEFVLDEPRSILVQTLILDAPHVSSTVLRKLIRSMGELKRLELALPNYCSPVVIERLRARFPRCELVARRSIQIDESYN